MKKIIYLLCLLFIIVGVSCTKKFNEINQNMRGLPSADFPAQTYLPSMMRWIYPDNGDGYGDFRAQTAYNLTSDAFASYFGSNWSTDNPSTYLLNLGWNGQLFDNWSRAMGLFAVIQTRANTTPKSLDSTILGMSFVVKVLFSQAVADYYGTLPYTSFGALQATYDPLDKIYQTFFNELDSALVYLDTAKLTTVGIDNSVDLFYGGNQKQWVKLANSLRMRVAMRIIKANPTLAQTQCEKAMANKGGLVLDNKDNATFHASTFNNPLYVYMYNYNGCRSSADMVCYLKGKVETGGVFDPRLPIYVGGKPDSASKVSGAGNFVGIRLGVLLQGGTTGNSRYYSVMGTYAPLNPASPSWALSNLPLFVTAETNFLLAEAKLRGWNMGTHSSAAKVFYEAGINASMQQWNVIIPSDYFTNPDYLKADFIDPVLATRNETANNILTSYDFSSTPEVALEQIITQKWIATWPGCGVNAWSEYRRTGYPRLFVPFSKAPSLDAIPKTITQNGTQQVNNMRKFGLAQNEYTNNAANVNKAVADYLKGNDGVNSLVWWDIPTTPNF